MVAAASMDRGAGAEKGGDIGGEGYPVTVSLCILIWNYTIGADGQHGSSHYFDASVEFGRQRARHHPRGLGFPVHGEDDLRFAVGGGMGGGGAQSEAIEGDSIVRRHRPVGADLATENPAMGGGQRTVL